MKKEIYQLTYDLEENYWWYVARRKIIFDQLHSLTLDVENKPSLLDVGCGTGKNLVCLSDFFEAYGIDSSTEALKFCRQRGLTKLKLLDPFNEKLKKNPFDRQFDYITMLDVLEHIEDDIHYLASISDWLTKDGKLFITVPAYQWLWSGEDYVSNHVRRYSKKQLEETIRKSGFIIEKISYFNFYLFPMQVLILLLKRIISPRSLKQTNLHEMPKFINSLLQNVMSAESPFLLKFGFPFGGSIFCICQKDEKAT